MENWTNKLKVFIVTYNRASLLKATLKKLQMSPIANCSITIMDNKSTDETRCIAESYKGSFHNLNVITNGANITGSGNILRAIENANSEYVWVLADDDDYDFSQFDDVAERLEIGDVDLIHVGAHDDGENWNCGGKIYKIQDLFAQGYHYFKYSSFMPCNIIRKSAFETFFFQGYENIVNHYAHMPFIQGIYMQNSLIYVAKNHIVHAVIGAQTYMDKWFTFWGNTCLLMDDFDGFMACLSDHVSISPNLSLTTKRFFLAFFKEGMFSNNAIVNFKLGLRIYKHLSKQERVRCIWRLFLSLLKMQAIPQKSLSK